MKIEVVEQKAERTLAYQEHATMDSLGSVMDKGLSSVYGHLKELGKHPIGAPYAAYRNANESENFAEFDLEVGFPVAEEIPLKDGLFMSKTYEGKVVSAMHKGPYQTLEQTYAAVMNYIAENGFVPVGVYYDYYLNDPASTKEEELLTKVVVPIH